MESLVPIDRAAQLLGISSWTVRKFLRVGKIKSVHIGRRVLIEQSELRRIVEQGKESRESANGDAGQ
jgi:excisionase family DNA binding protein